MEFVKCFWMLCIGHCLADYPLQGDFLARAKNHKNAVLSVPWPWALGAHAMIHSGAVWLVTGSCIMAGVELLLHAVIDYAKCDQRITFTSDQLAHIACKGLYAAIC